MTSSTLELTSGQLQQLDALAEVIHSRPPLVAFTGAGISTNRASPTIAGHKDSGRRAAPNRSPTRSSWPARRRDWPGGMPCRSDTRRAAGESTTRDTWRSQPLSGRVLSTRSSPRISTASTPTPGSEPERVIELHGTRAQSAALNAVTIPSRTSLISPPVCRHRRPAQTAAEHPEIGHGRLWPADAARGTAQRLHSRADGGCHARRRSTLLVNPAARVPAIAKASGAQLAIVNIGETALDEEADLRIEAPAGPALTVLAEMLLTT